MVALEIFGGKSVELSNYVDLLVSTNHHKMTLCVKHSGEEEKLEKKGGFHQDLIFCRVLRDSL